tara:strand:+ start:876 stop:1220 length:345 start_codon:yes stop_codon:yes gene_type:complete
MDNESPLQYLDIDVTRYIYEKYFPTKLAKYFKDLVIQQLKEHLNNYLTDYNFINIYERKNRIPIHRNKQVLYSFNNYLVDHIKIKKKRKDPYRVITGGYRRARKYRREAHKKKL